MSQSTIASRLAGDVVSREYADLGTETRERLKCHLLDWIGVTIGGHAHANSTDAITTAVDAVAGDGDAATGVGTADMQPVAAAALRNGALAHSLDFDDTHRESSLHPAAPTVAAALAMGESEVIDGETLLTAIAAGYDVTCGVGIAVDADAHYQQGFHVTATCGTFGATAATAVVADLDAAELAAAFGANGSQAAGSLQFLTNGAWNKRLHPGLAARRAVLATELGRAGFRGAEAPLEGEHGFLQGYSDTPRPDRLDDLPQNGEMVLETGLKPYPCCRYMHPALDALTTVGNEVNATDVDRVVVDLPSPGVTLTGDPIESKRRPNNFVDCQFSMPFTAAWALREGEAGLSAFLEAQEELADPALRELMDSVEVVTTDAVMTDFPRQWPARVVVEGDGIDVERRVDTALGEPENPMDWDAVTTKFRELCDTAGVPESALDEIVQTVDQLEAHSARDLTKAIGNASQSRSVPADD